MINEANASSSACRLWRIHQVETSARPSNIFIITENLARVKIANPYPPKVDNTY